MNARPARVVVVGAGRVGLAAAIELGSRGIRCRVLEKNDRVGHASGRRVDPQVRERIGADGAGSRARQTIGATMAGGRTLGRHTNIIFRAPGLAAAHRHGPAIMYWQVNADVPSVTGPMDQGEKWYFGSSRLPGEAELGKVDVPAMIRRATGIDWGGILQWISHSRRRRGHPRPARTD